MKKTVRDNIQTAYSLHDMNVIAFELSGNDVTMRTQEEYDEGHIPGAIVISHEEIAEKAKEVLTDKDQLILVYCRSGRRSKIAAEALVELGYTNIKEFGGIIDWPYEVE